MNGWSTEKITTVGQVWLRAAVLLAVLIVLLVAMANNSNAAMVDAVARCIEAGEDPLICREAIR